MMIYIHIYRFVYVYRHIFIFVCECACTYMYQSRQHSNNFESEHLSKESNSTYTTQIYHTKLNHLQFSERLPFWRRYYMQVNRVQKTCPFKKNLSVTWLCRSYIWRDSIVYMCDVTRLFICVTWLVCVRDTKHSGVEPVSFICVTWLIHVCDVTHSHVRLMDRRKYPKIPHTHTQAHTHVRPPNSPWHKTTQDNTTRARTNSHTHTSHIRTTPKSPLTQNYMRELHIHTHAHIHAQTHTHNYFDEEEDFFWTTCATGQIFNEIKTRCRQDLSKKMRRRPNFSQIL